MMKSQIYMAPILGVLAVAFATVTEVRAQDRNRQEGQVHYWQPDAQGSNQ